MSDGAVRAQRWYLEQRPYCYCCEGCWQIALSRSISMKNEISASCENSAPQGLAFLWPLRASRNSMGCTWPKLNPSSSAESSLPAPSQLPSAWGHNLLPKHPSQTKEQGWEEPEELLTTDRGGGSCLGFGSTLPTSRAAFNLSLSGWPSPGDNPSPCHPTWQVKAAQGPRGPANTTAPGGTARVQYLLSHHTQTSTRASDLRIDPAGPCSLLPELHSCSLKMMS